MFYIYGLRVKGDSEYRYIGCTSAPAGGVNKLMRVGELVFATVAPAGVDHVPIRIANPTVNPHVWVLEIAGGNHFPKIFP